MRHFMILLAFWTIAAAAGADETLPPGYRMDHYRAPAPATLPGATVLSTAALQKQLAQSRLLLIDVMPANRVPDGAGGTRWVPDAPRLNLPGSVWLPNVGYGALEPQIAGWFASQLRRLTGGEPDTAILFYCRRDCWMSWNAARRALSLGYLRVLWYPDGSDGWAEAGLPLQAATPEPVR